MKQEGKNFVIGFLELAALFLIGQLPSLVMGVMIGLSKVRGKISGSMPFSSEVVLMILIVLSLFFVLIIAKKFGIFNRLSFDAFSKKNIRLMLLAYLACWGVSILGTILMPQGETTDNQVAVEQLSNFLPMSVFVASTVILAPVSEELAFRGAVLSKMLKDFPKMAILVSALLFGFAHGAENIGAMVIYAGMGCVFAIIYKKTGRIELNITLHMFWNLIATMIMYSGVSS